VKLFYDGYQIYKAREENKATPTQESTYSNIAKKFATDIGNLDDMYDDYEDEEGDVKKTSQAISAVESFLNGLKSTGQETESQTINYLNNSKNPVSDLRTVFSTGYFDIDKKVQKVEGGQIDISTGDWWSVLRNALALDV
jgi:hypothetical protein